MSTSNQPLIPGYEIQKILGKGGMGTVYLAIQSSLNRQVALKVINTTMAEQDATFNQRFVKEANATAALSHANIITVYDAGEYQKCSYMAMEYIPSGTLANLDVSKLSTQQICLLFIKISKGLSVAHKAGFVHRDIKPENILMAPNGNPIVTDFGIVKSINTDTSLTETGTTIGTPQYMSPEQITDMDVDGRSDLYSLGVVMYNFLEGRVPFEGQTSTAIYIKHVNDAPPPLSPKNNKFQAIISKLLEKESSNRYNNADELVTALKYLMENAHLDSNSHKSTVVNTNFENRNTNDSDHLTKKTGKKSNKKQAVIMTTVILSLFIALFIYNNYSKKQEKIEQDKASQLVIEANKEKIIKDKQDSDKRDKDKWFIASTENTASAYQSYLDVFPKGLYSKEAQKNIGGLKQQSELHSDNVSEVQQLLLKLGYQLNINGELDKRTIASIKDFESKQKMTVTGIADEILITLLKKTYTDQDKKAWAQANKIHTQTAYQNYRKQYPEGAYINLVDNKINEAKKAFLLQQKMVDEKNKNLTETVKKPESKPVVEVVNEEPKQKKNHCEECPQMVVIPAGSFQMGSDDGAFLEKPIPVHQVNIKQFSMGVTEVTFDQWNACYLANGCSHNPKDKSWGRGNRPVISVNWNDAHEYINWIKNKTGKKYRLPTEAEWEYAARAGSRTHYSWGNNISCDQADYHHSKCNTKGTSPVKSYQPNKFGLFDMNGNVAEWTQDCWTKFYHKAPTDGSPRLTGNCNQRVLRGGAWNSLPEHVTSHFRLHINRATRWSYFGFRLAMDN